MLTLHVSLITYKMSKAICLSPCGGKPASLFAEQTWLACLEDRACLWTVVGLRIPQTALCFGTAFLSLDLAMLVP